VEATEGDFTTETQRHEEGIEIRVPDVTQHRTVHALGEATRYRGLEKAAMANRSLKPAQDPHQNSIPFPLLTFASLSFCGENPAATSSPTP
jgi:hypothetical protein